MGSQVGQDHGAVRPGQHPGEVEHAYASKRPFHRDLLSGNGKQEERRSRSPITCFLLPRPCFLEISKAGETRSHRSASVPRTSAEGKAGGAGLGGRGAGSLRAGGLTRKVDNLVQALGMTDINRKLEGDCPYVWLDATSVKVRKAGRAVSAAVVVAIGVRASGEREVLGLDVGPAGRERSGWPACGAWWGVGRGGAPGGQ
jgi:hypothetical protein